MRLRSRLKKLLYGSVPGIAGKFPYFGVNVYFPRKSLIFELACDQGIYESANVRVLESALVPDTTYIDVGANIGLMSIPALAANHRIRVVSIEPSPAAFSCLECTARESAYRDRWQTLRTAIGDRTGTTEFHSAVPSLGAYDGVRDSGRGGPTSVSTVPMTTIDEIWRDIGKTRLSAIKIDVEGLEANVLAGARSCLAACRPVILIEWNERNLESNNCPPARLLQIAEESGYTVHGMPSLVRIETEPHLLAHMRFDESFVLFPKT